MASGECENLGMETFKDKVKSCITMGLVFSGMVGISGEIFGRNNWLLSLAVAFAGMLVYGYFIGDPKFQTDSKVQPLPLHQQ